MQIDATVLTALNQVLGESLIAINQYFLHGRMLRHQGLKALDERITHQSIREMKLADRLMQRIFLLEGLPNLQDLGKLLVGENMAEVLACDLRLETRKHAVVRAAIAVCEQQRDYVSRALLLEVQNAYEEHLDWLQTQTTLLRDMGAENYAQLQAAHDD